MFDLAPTIQICDGVLELYLLILQLCYDADINSECYWISQSCDSASRSCLNKHNSFTIMFIKGDMYLDVSGLYASFYVKGSTDGTLLLL